MKDSFELKGKWSLPSNPKKEVYGVAKFDSNNGGSLEILGNFSNNYFGDRDDNLDIIWGITNESKSITLYKCFVIFRTGPTLKQGEPIGEPLSRYYVNFIFEGAHLKIEELIFDKLKVELFNLAQWLGIDGFQYNKDRIELIKNNECSIHYKLPEPINFQISNSLSGCFNVHAKTPSWSRYNESQTISQSVELTLQSSIDLIFEDFFIEMRKFQNFLTLALYSSTYPLQITLSKKDLVTDLGPEFGDRRYSPKKINVYCKSRVDSIPSNIKHHFQMLFEYKHIKRIFQEVYQKWDNLHIRLEPVFNILFEQFYNSRFSENSFLNLAQALETFHARMHDSINKMSKVEYERMKKHLLDVSSSEYHDWLNQLFPFGNMPTLQQRLDYMVNSYWNDLLDTIVPNKKEFTKKIKKARNYYTHYSSDDKKAPKGLELYDLAQPIKVILCVAILKNIGFSNDLIEEIFKNGFIGFNG